MLINFQPAEIVSKTANHVINELQTTNHDLRILSPKDKNSKEWQNIITSSEELILLMPVYWWGFGYEFDHWVQDTFTYNFAYNFDNGHQQGLLKGRKFTVYLTHGTPDSNFEIMKDIITKRLTIGIFGYCGCDVSINFVQSLSNK
jgi:putative NADPH-quinone reductase